MPVPDIYKIVDDHLWSLLELRNLPGQWASIVKAANRIKVGDKYDPVKNIQNTSDYPQVILFIAAAADTTTNLFRTFGNVKGTCGARVSDIRVEATLGITHQDFRRASVNPVILETQAAWEDAQATLNPLLQAAIATCAIQQWGPLVIDTDWTGKRPPLVPIVDPDGTPRPTTIIKSPLTIRFNSAGKPLN